MTDEDLELWRGSPVTDLLLSNLRRLAEQRKFQMLESYWAGNPPDPEDMAQAKAEFAILDDLTGATAADVLSTKEQMDEAEYERKRNEAD